MGLWFYIHATPWYIPYQRYAILKWYTKRMKTRGLWIGTPWYLGDLGAFSHRKFEILQALGVAFSAWNFLINWRTPSTSLIIWSHDARQAFLKSVPKIFGITYMYIECTLMLLLTPFRRFPHQLKLKFLNLVAQDLEALDASGSKKRQTRGELQ